MSYWQTSGSTSQPVDVDATPDVTTEVVINLTAQMNSMAESHAGKTWTITAALVADTLNEPDLPQIKRQVLQKGVRLAK